MRIGKIVNYRELPYKVISKHRGFDDNYFVLEPVSESPAIRCAQIRVFEKELSELDLTPQNK